MNYLEIKIGKHELKTRLGARDIIKLEKKLSGNPLNVLVAASGGKAPEISSLLAILHASLQKLEHGWTEEKVFDLYDEFIDEGRTYSDLVNIIMDIFRFSGFLPKEAEGGNEGE